MCGIRIGGIIAAVFLLSAPASPADRSIGPTPRHEGPGTRGAHDGHFIVAGNTAGPGGKLSIPQPRPTFQRAPAGAGERAATRAAQDAWRQQQLLQQHGASGKRYGRQDARQREYCERNPKSRHCGYRGESSSNSGDTCQQKPQSKACLAKRKR